MINREYIFHIEFYSEYHLSPPLLAQQQTGVSAMPDWKRSRVCPPKTWLKQITVDKHHCCTSTGLWSSYMESSHNGRRATCSVMMWLYIYTVGHKKTCHFYFYDNFGKCGPISIILSLLDS